MTKGKRVRVTSTRALAMVALALAVGCGGVANQPMADYSIGCAGARDTDEPAPSSEPGPPYGPCDSSSGACAKGTCQLVPGGVPYERACY
jgi:hypothetical protein